MTRTIGAVAVGVLGNVVIMSVVPVRLGVGLGRSISLPTNYSTVNLTRNITTFTGFTTSRVLPGKQIY